MTPSDYAPPANPTADEQRAALRRGLGRAAMWASSGKLDEALLAEAWLADWRYDRQIDSPRGDWLFGLAESLGAIARLRGPLLRALGHLSDGPANERGAGQLCALALRYAQAGDAVFRVRLYDIVGRKPIPPSHRLGEHELIRLDGEAGFLFAARARGRRLGDDPGWTGAGDFMFTAGEVLGRDRAATLLDASADEHVARFRDHWRDIEAECDAAPRQTYAEQTATLTPGDIVAAAESPSPLRRHLGGWGKLAEPADLKVVAAHLWAATDPKAVAKLLQVFAARALPEFDPRLIELCRHADSDVSWRALKALEENAHPMVRDYALAELARGEASAVGLLVRNYEPGDEGRVLAVIEAPAPDGEHEHGPISDALELLEANPGADASRLGVACYARTPCGHCRATAARLLVARGVAPDWLLGECRHDAEADIRELVANPPGTDAP